MYANNERQKEQMQLQDIYNWQLGQYIEEAHREALTKAFGKHADIYPKEPLFASALLNSDRGEVISKSQEELETLKFKEFFSNLGNHVAIKKKGGTDGR